MREWIEVPGLACRGLIGESGKTAGRWARRGGKRGVSMDEERVVGPEERVVEPEERVVEPEERVVEPGERTVPVDRIRVPAPPAVDRSPMRSSRGYAASLECPRCATPHARGAVFCPSCRSYLEAPDVGKLATPKRRLLAAFLDSTFRDGGLIGSFFGPLLIGSGRTQAIVRVLSTAYWGLTLYLWTKGTTPAKRALDMDVIREDGEPAGFLRMAFRETIGKAISLAVLGLGYLSVLLDRNHQGWHDKMAGTFVVLDEEK